MTGQEKNERSRVAGWSPAASARLKEAVKEYGSQGAVAAAASISRPSLVEILAGRSVPTNGTLLRLCEVTGRTWDDILGASEAVASDTNPMVLVPLHDVLVSAGHGLQAMEAGISPENLGFPRAWLRQQFGQTDNLRVVRVQGDSMSPTLSDGDLAMISLDRRDPVDGIFVLRIDDQLLVKRVHFPMQRRVIITSDNRDYDRWDRMLDLGSEATRDAFQLIGRVVWIGRSI